MNIIRIETERLIIRPFAMGDLNDVTALIRDKMSGDFAPYDTQWPTDNEGIKGTLDYYINSKPWEWCAVELKATGHVIGFVCAGEQRDMSRGIGYTIRSDHQNNGYGYEACRSLMLHCQNALGTRRFVAGTVDCNIPSIKLLHKLGFAKFRSFVISFVANTPAVAAGEYECIV